MFHPESYGMVFEGVSEDDSETSEKEDTHANEGKEVKKSRNRSAELTSKFEELKEKRQTLLHRAELRKAQREEQKHARMKKKEDEKLAEKRKLDESLETVEPNASGPSPEAIEKRWAEIRSYIDVNQHLKGVDHGQLALKSGLEKQIDEAVKTGDVSTSEKLSDQLACREFGSKVADAFQAEAWKKEMNKQKSVNDSRKAKKIKWGFEPKHRWETKGNM